MENSMQPPLDSEPLWTAKDVADYLKASTSWVYLHADDGTLPSLRIAGLRRFIPEQIRAFARGEAVPTSKLVSMSGRGR
jgi:hypothetical protein